jgi:LmbE family N-acetylglucosaminyl deacetylase
MSIHSTLLVNLGGRIAVTGHPEMSTIQKTTAQAQPTDMAQEAATHSSEAPDAWDTPQKILVILAHPDDPEFFCGASIARWTKAGHEVVYWLLTCGDKGTSDRTLNPDELCCLRQDEQRAAAARLGVNEVHFLGHPDGYLVPDLSLRKEVTRIIRQVQPDVLVTCDPTTLFVGDNRLNHPDHRACGQVVLDAVFPAARDHLNFIELWRDEHLEPHNVREVWISGSLQPTIRLDVTEQWETKIKALWEHRSQIGDPARLEERIRSRLAPGASLENPRYEEAFRRIIFD